VNLVKHGMFSEAPGPPYHPGVLRAPGYPVFLAGLHAISLHSLILVRIEQFAVLAATALVVYRIAISIAGMAATLASGLLCATYLPLVWLAANLLSEVLACLCVALLVLSLLWAGSSPVRWAAAGAVLAASCYVRPDILGAHRVRGPGRRRTLAHDPKVAAYCCLRRGRRSPPGAMDRPQPLPHRSPAPDGGDIGLEFARLRRAVQPARCPIPCSAPVASRGSAAVASELRPAASEPSGPQRRTRAF
jgi:hypothetical protein